MNDGEDDSAAAYTMTIDVNVNVPVISLAGPTLAANGGYLFEAEGADLRGQEVAGGGWVLTRTGDGAGDLTVNVTVSESGGNFIPGGSEGSQTVAFEDGETTVDYRPIVPDDTREDHGTVTVTLATGTGYTVDATANSATAAVRDDDKRIDVDIEPQDLTVNEGDTIRFYAVARTTDPTTFTEYGDIARYMTRSQGFYRGQSGDADFSCKTGPAEATGPDDYAARSAARRLLTEDFAADGANYSARVECSPVFDILDDGDDEEGVERFAVYWEQAPGLEHGFHRFVPRSDPIPGDLGGTMLHVEKIKTKAAEGPLTLVTIRGHAKITAQEVNLDAAPRERRVRGGGGDRDCGDLGGGGDGDRDAGARVPDRQFFAGEGPPMCAPTWAGRGWCSPTR